MQVKNIHNNKGPQKSPIQSAQILNQYLSNVKNICEDDLRVEATILFMVKIAFS